jgi:hypothetical protein
MGNLEDHLAYHAGWQAEVVTNRAWFRRQNRIAGKVARMVEWTEQGVEPERIAALREAVLDDLAPFRPTPGLCAVERSDGSRVLVLEVATDIEDDTYLDEVRRAVEQTWSEAEAARERRFVLEVRWRRLAPDALYPGGTPARGAAIDVQRHRDRFPEEALVLTSGAKSTHAWTGRSVLLGPSPLHRRTLAHEFGHLLGFDDAYLRGYEGDPAGPWGATLFEWVGLRDDLMGNPTGGRVTARMVDRLLEAYGEGCPSR